MIAQNFLRKYFCNLHWRISILQMKNLQSDARREND